jgi:hypothetical protein
MPFGFEYESGTYLFASNPFIFQQYDVKGLLDDMISNYWNEVKE